MKTKQSIIWILIIITLSSCSINGSFQGLFSYYNKTKKESSIAFSSFNSTNDCFYANSDSLTVLIANGKQIQSCLKNHQHALIYIWSPNCKSEHCYSLDILAETCRRKGIELFIVAEYYDSYHMRKNYKLARPIIGIDISYYKTNITSKYLRKFILDLTNRKLDIKDNTNVNFMSFERGKLMRTFVTIEEI